MFAQRRRRDRVLLGVAAPAGANTGTWRVRASRRRRLERTDNSWVSELRGGGEGGGEGGRGGGGVQRPPEGEREVGGSGDGGSGMLLPWAAG
eukprot:9468713-Pyramimonas_sp.AAC.2